MLEFIFRAWWLWLILAVVFGVLTRRNRQKLEALKRHSANNKNMADNHLPTEHSSSHPPQIAPVTPISPNHSPETSISLGAMKKQSHRRRASRASK